MDESPLENNVAVLTINKAQSEGKITDIEGKIWHGLSNNEVLDSVNRSCTKISRSSDVNDEERPLKRSELMTEKAYEP